MKDLKAKDHEKQAWKIDRKGLDLVDNMLHASLPSRKSWGSLPHLDSPLQEKRGTNLEANHRASGVRKAENRGPSLVFTAGGLNLLSHV